MGNNYVYVIPKNNIHKPQFLNPNLFFAKTENTITFFIWAGKTSVFQLLYRMNTLSLLYNHLLLSVVQL